MSLSKDCTITLGSTNTIPIEVTWTFNYGENYMILKHN
jgi:hypothetical protein